MKITKKTEEYSRTESGKSWKTKPEKVETSEVNENFYNNFTSAETSMFFRNLGGYEKRVYNYTSRGYRVVRVVSINPGRTVKKETSFSFE